ncbi:hypothetical protein [Corynebacterium nasicanis]|uniref:Uncharacterized protein n=1 Tax=Corynebacterium nasicanis TaxID=1448267 RepID=A0ABW1QGX3_9CORY
MKDQGTLYTDVLVYYFGSGHGIAALKMDNAVKKGDNIQNAILAGLPLTIEGTRMEDPFEGAAPLLSEGDLIHLVFPLEVTQENPAVESTYDLRCAGAFRSLALAQARLREVQEANPCQRFVLRTYPLGWESAQLSLD